MIYEELKLRPASGSIDRDAITAWLETKDYAFLDPITGKVWHLSLTSKAMERSRHARITDPTDRMTCGVSLLLFPDHVSLDAYWADHDEDGRALEFIRWLVREGEWTVQRDQSPFEPLGDPARLFREGTVEPPETDHTRDEVTEGVCGTRGTPRVAGSSSTRAVSGEAMTPEVSSRGRR